MLHLLGGLLILAGLWWLKLRLSESFKYSIPNKQRHYRPWILMGFIILFMQIALGGWVSANYAGIACAGFPLCNGIAWPSMHIGEAFNFSAAVGANYQGGLLENQCSILLRDFFLRKRNSPIRKKYVTQPI